MWSANFNTCLLRCFFYLPLLIVLLMTGNNVAHSSENKSASTQQVVDPDLLDLGYPDEGEPDHNVTDAEDDLNDSFPHRDSVFPGIAGIREWGIWDGKRKLYENYGLKLGASYQMLYQKASDTLPNAEHDTALGHWWGFTSRWTPLNRGEDYEGSLIFTAHERVAVGSHSVPAPFGAGQLGSSWSNFEFTEWDFAVEDLYWEQSFEKGRGFVRVGNQIPTTIFNSFRYKDARTSFTASPFAFHETIPYPTYGFGIAGKWWPIENSEFYVVGTLNDMNGNPNTRALSWGTFSRGEYFYGIEVGHNWRRANGEFDHLHLDIFFADERSTRSPDTFPNEEGGGFKILGSKQMGRLVGFGSYTYNQAKGGGISVTFSRQTGTVGMAYLKPFGIQGEVSLGLMWQETLPDLFPGVKNDSEDQYGLEVYWKILLTPNMFITPGFQYIRDPAFNKTADSIFIPHVKFRIWL